VQTEGETNVIPDNKREKKPSHSAEQKKGERESRRRREWEKDIITPLTAGRGVLLGKESE